MILIDGGSISDFVGNHVLCTKRKNKIVLYWTEYNANIHVASYLKRCPHVCWNL